ncbi:hypothetical protein [Methylobacterium sp. J-090]|uniref:hypothetical protein n=1 Tax=Methylobacterium sp. J-090 TaxID=2836666 RepID=UPI001FB87A54|nr:hypothetical protein [Methylobacterium sp. J-090]MCJ2083773.1 hypothetical protein [Methylobacterium sp. J-090]
MDDPTNAACLAKLPAMAAILGIPVESFFVDNEAAERLAGASECAQLWDQIKTADGRRRALVYLREVADEPHP